MPKKDNMIVEIDTRTRITQSMKKETIYDRCQ